MGKYLLLILFIQLAYIKLSAAIPVNTYDDHLVIYKDALIDDDGHYVQVASVVEEQEPVLLLQDLSRADLADAVLRDEEDEEEVQGPGYQGILAGLSGIFSNVVNGNLGKVVESTFNFVPPMYVNNVQGVYNSLLGKPPLTTSTAEPAEPAAAEVAEVATTAATAAAKPAAAAAVAVPVGGTTQKTALSAAVAASAGADEDEDQEDAARKLYS